MTTEWQPISTAPRDGTVVLLWGTPWSMAVPDMQRIVGYWQRGWQAYGVSIPLSHVKMWRQLPAAPHPSLYLPSPPAAGESA